MLETRFGTGGGSAIQFLDDPGADNEMYLDVHLGSASLVSPDPRLDLIADFIGNAAADVERLIREIKRLKGASA